MNFKMIAYHLGTILRIEGFLLFLPTIVSVVYQEQRAANAFVATITMCWIAGAICVTREPEDTRIYGREGFVVAALSWIMMSVFGAFPYYLSGVATSFMDCFFETVSGFTTTGATIFTEIEHLPNSILFWRCFTHWIGGMGILIFMIAIMPTGDERTMYLMKAEAPGPMVSKLVPKAKTTAKLMYEIYIALTLLEILLLHFGGMGWFDSIIHGISTAGTGGFSNKNESIAAFDDAYIQYVIAIFMLLFSINFNLYYLLFVRRWKDVWKNEELRYFLCIAAGGTGIIAINLCTQGNYQTIEESFRHALFHVASIMSTTGFVVVDYDLWPEFAKALLFCLMFLGACGSSTAGGIKISRFIILLKVIGREIRRIVHPRSVNLIKMDGYRIEEEVVHGVTGYIIFYVFILLGSFILLSFNGFDFVSNMTAVTTCLSNVGPGLSLAGPTEPMTFFSPFSKFVLCMDMLLGRLEIFPMMLLFAPSVWKKSYM